MAYEQQDRRGPRGAGPVAGWKARASLWTLAVSALAAQPTFAQDAADVDPASAVEAAGDGIGVIIVTANRREASLQDVGIAVTAFSGKRLTELGVTETSALTAVTPGLQLDEGGSSPLIGLLSIRGVSQNDFAGHIESPNAFYVDDVYQPSISSSIQQLYDVSRVEVLKGPQGTLFGRNATGGLIHVITNRPTHELGGFFDVSYGDFNLLRLEGALNLPLSDTVQTRISFLRKRNDGWIKNDIGPDLNEDDTYAARIHLAFQPNDALDILLTGDVYKINDITAGGSFATAGEPNNIGLGVHLPPGTPTSFGYVDADGDPFTASFDFPGFLDREVWSFAGRFSYDFGGVTLTGLVNHQDLESDYAEDNDLSPVPFTQFRQTADAKHTTAELRLLGETPGLSWTAGVYYLAIDGSYLQGFDIQALGTDLEARYELDTKSYSLFGQVEHELSDRLTLIAGLRWTRDEKDYDFRQRCVGGFCGLFVAPGTIGAAGRVQDSHGESGWSGRLQLDWRPADDLLLYASINRGYKAFNYNAGFAGLAPLSAVRFSGEEIMAYEIGNKLDFWGGRGRLNAAAFYYDYSDYQAFDQRGLNFTLFNTKARVYGADAELTLQPVDGLTLFAGLSLLNTKVKDVPIATLLLDRDAPQAPGATLLLGATQAVEFGFGTLRGTINATYTDGYYSQLTNAPVTAIPSNWLVNARLSLATLEEKLELSLFVNNLLDEKRQTYAFDITGPPLGLVENNYAEPRWVGVQGRFNF